LSSPIEKYLITIRYLIELYIKFSLFFCFVILKLKIVDNLCIGKLTVILYNFNMEFSLLTYNVLFNKAFSQVESILKKHHPDIVCLQEVETTEANLQQIEKEGYLLADYANCFIKSGKVYGVATFYHKKRIRLINSKPIPLSRSFYEGFTSLFQFFQRRRIRRTILKTDLYIKNVKRVVSFYNVHLSVMSLNNLRLKQLKTIDLASLENKKPLVITGDFNFPVERKKLERFMHRYHLREATDKLFYTLKYPKNPADYSYQLLQRLFGNIIKKIWTDKLKLDYVFYRQLKNMETSRIEVSFSDHFPIISKFEF